MPLYTYISVYRGGTYVDQDRQSNFKGFAPLLLGKMPDNVLPGMTTAVRKELAEKAYRSEWEAVPNRAHVWRTSFDLKGHHFSLYAVQTEP